LINFFATFDTSIGLPINPQIQALFPFYRLYGTKTMMLSMGLLLMAILALSCISTGIFKQQNQALGQSYVQTIKYRNLVINLGNGVKTKVQLTYPAVGKDVQRLGFTIDKQY
jgi:hypothetical protein